MIGQTIHYLDVNPTRRRDMIMMGLPTTLVDYNKSYYNSINPQGPTV